MAAAQSVADILNAAQDSRSEAARSRCAAQLWKLVLQDPDSTTDELLECVDYLMTISQVCGPFSHLCTALCSTRPQLQHQLVRDAPS